jgi:hypothetical protein
MYLRDVGYYLCYSGCSHPEGRGTISIRNFATHTRCLCFEAGDSTETSVPTYQTTKLCRNTVSSPRWKPQFVANI